MKSTARLNRVVLKPANKCRVVFNPALPELISMTISCDEDSNQENLKAVI